MHRLLKWFVLSMVTVSGTPALAQDDMNWGEFLGSEGASFLAQMCRETKDSGRDFQCKMLRRLCEPDTESTTRACEILAGKKAGDAAMRVLDVKPVELPNPNVLPKEVVEAHEECQKDEKCISVADIATKKPRAEAVLKAWCSGRLIVGATSAEWPTVVGRKLVEKVCTNALSNDLSAISAYELGMLKEEAGRPIVKCDGFGLMTPVFTFRRPGNGTVNVKALSALGGGYYWAAPKEWNGCQKDWTWGFEVFGYTEGIDLTKQEMHLGVGAGVGISATKYFKFGLGLGYDIYRQSADDTGAINRNGLLAAKLLGTQSISYLVTFTITSGGGSSGGETKE